MKKPFPRELSPQLLPLRIPLRRRRAVEDPLGLRAPSPVRKLLPALLRRAESAVPAKIQEFLNQYKGYGNLFQNYEIGEPRQDPVTKQITCDVTLTPFYAAKNFIIKVAADKKDKEAALANG